MTDADRLREAAGRCDAWAADTKAANSALLTGWKIDAATADLLRAVADEGYAPKTWNAALALADSILGSAE